MLIRHPDSARGNDLYESPEVATLSLLAVEPLPPTILEPACGRGAISKVLRRAGHTVIENDVVDYRRGQNSVQDFLDLKPAWADEIDAVVTNPPYRLAQQTAEPDERVARIMQLSDAEQYRIAAGGARRNPSGHGA